MTNVGRIKCLHTLTKDQRDHPTCLPNARPACESALNSVPPKYLQGNGSETHMSYQEDCIEVFAYVLLCCMLNQHHESCVALRVKIEGPCLDSVTSVAAVEKLE